VIEEGLRTALKNADAKCYEERSEKPPALPSAAGC
jgi:dihydrolipoamide dehydrogenase